MFESQVRVLQQQGYRVILWDLRGHGQSALVPGTRFTASDAAAALEALITTCDVTDPVVVGHSLGGNLAQDFARENPERVSGVIVLDSAWDTGPLSRLERFALRLAAPPLALIPSGRLPGVMARASAVSSEAVARTETLFARMPKDRLLDVWRATTSFVSPDSGYRSPVPLAVVRGAEDRNGNIATAMPRWAAPEGIAEHVIANAGHLVTWDAPDETSTVLHGILDTWSDDTGTTEHRP